MLMRLPDLANVPDMPLGLALLIAALLLIGSGFVFVGALGLAFFKNFYDRLHMPALGATMGLANISLAAIIYLSYQAGSLVLRDALIFIFLNLTAPISAMLLARAASMRDFTQSWRNMSDNMFHQIAAPPKNSDAAAQAEETDRQANGRKRKKSAKQTKAAADSPPQTDKIAPTAKTADSRKRKTKAAAKTAKADAAKTAKTKAETVKAGAAKAEAPAKKPRRPRKTVISAAKKQTD